MRDVSCRICTNYDCLLQSFVNRNVTWKNSARRNVDAVRNALFLNHTVLRCSATTSTSFTKTHSDVESRARNRGRLRVVLFGDARLNFDKATITREYTWDNAPPSFYSDTQYRTLSPSIFVGDFLQISRGDRAKELALTSSRMFIRLILRI